MTTPEIVERHPRPKCPLAPDCPGHCSLCLQPQPNCKGHDPARYVRFSMPTEPTPCPDQPRYQPKPAESEDQQQYNVL